LKVNILNQSNLTVSEGDPASFTCLVHCDSPGIACVGVSAHWARYESTNDSIKQLPDGAKVSVRHTNTTLSFPSTTAGDMGMYICTAMIQNFTDSDVAYLTVNGNNCNYIPIITMYLYLRLITKDF